jgi:hypothetical protein
MKSPAPKAVLSFVTPPSEAESRLANLTTLCSVW